MTLPYPKGARPARAAGSKAPCLCRLPGWEPPPPRQHPLQRLSPPHPRCPCGEGARAPGEELRRRRAAPRAGTATPCRCRSRSPAAHPEAPMRSCSSHEGATERRVREEGRGSCAGTAGGGEQPRGLCSSPGLGGSRLPRLSWAQRARSPASSTISAVHIYLLNASKEAVLFRAPEFAPGAGWTFCPVAPSMQAAG